MRGARSLLVVLLLGLTGAAASPVAAQEIFQGSPEGKPVSAVLVEGNERHSDAELVAVLGIRPGDAFHQGDVERGLEELFRVHRVLARVEYRPAPGTAGAEVELLLRVEKELEVDFEPRFIGNVHVDEEDILEWAGLREGDELYLYQASRVRDRILKGYRSEGYYFAEVRAVTRTGEEADGDARAADVIFDIKEGPKVRVKDVVLHGNHVLGDGRVLFFRLGLTRLAKSELRKPILFGLFSKAFVEDTLDADIVAMRQVYRDLGYLDAVVNLERLEFDEEREWVTIHIAIDEGVPYRVRSVRIEAIRRVPRPDDPERYDERPTELLFPEEELLELLDAEPGAVWDKPLREHDVRALRRHYGERGYIDHPTLPDSVRLEVLPPELVFDEEEPVVDVVYRVAQGSRQFIRDVRVTGNLHTRDEVIRRLITVDPGAEADPEEIERSRQRIQGTGWFSDRRDVAHREPYYRFLETGDPAWKDLEYVVDEGQDLNFNISGGVSSNLGAFGIVEFSKRNFDVTNLPSSPLSLIRDVADRRAFHGAGQELRLRASPGTRVSFFDVYFFEPDIFDRYRDRISLSLNARRRLRIFETHDEEREEFGFQFGRQVGDDSSVFLGYTVGTVDVSDIDGGGEPVLNDPLTVPDTLLDQEGKNDIADIEFGFRMRTTDSRINPRNGLSLYWENQVYDQSWGSDFEFVKSELNFDWYDEFDTEGDEVPNRYHIELGGGVAKGYGVTDDIPYSERFFLGGQTRLRGFDFRGVGPNQKGFPLGGETYLYSSFEYRIPIVTTTQPGTYEEIETMHTGVFVDAGVLGPDDFAVDFGEYRASAGVLFGISVPLPITFSFGFPLRQGSGDDTQVLGFNIGF